MSMFRYSTVITNTSPENSFPEEIDKSISTPNILQQKEKDEGFYGFSDTVSEPDHFRESAEPEFVKSPFKLRRKGSKTSRRAKNMEASDPPTPNVSDTSLVPERAAPTVGEMLERPVALSARLR
jgi:hypothetical protein